MFYFLHKKFNSSDRFKVVLELFVAKRLKNQRFFSSTMTKFSFDRGGFFRKSLNLASSCGETVAGPPRIRENAEPEKVQKRDETRNTREAGQ